LKAKKLIVASMFLLLITGSINIVHAGISVTVIEVNPNVFNQGETATYTVSVESITTENENLQLSILVPSGDLELNWTYVETVLATGTTENYGLAATYNGTSAGNINFTVYGEAWSTSYNYSQALDLGLLETSSYTAYVYGPISPEPTPDVPELPSLLVISITLTVTLGMSLIFKKSQVQNVKDKR
jgi:hypothetical protein